MDLILIMMVGRVSPGPPCLYAKSRVFVCLFFLSVAPGYAPQSLSIQREYQLNFHIINWNLSNPDPTSSEYIALLWDINDKVGVFLTPPISPYPECPSYSSA